MRKSSLVFLYIALSFFLLVAALAHAAWQREERAPSLRDQAELVRALELTDLCLFTEARYTRHPSQADLHSSFQDHPVSLEHFPSGSLVTPRNGRLEQHADLD
jgi:hypothetical protein